MLIYAGEFNGRFPKSGGVDNRWVSSLSNWMAQTRNEAFGISGYAGDGKTTVSSHLYLLVKYRQISPKYFICHGETAVKEFKLPDANQLADVWDFGNKYTGQYCSYAYHAPFGSYALRLDKHPRMAVLADRNPWLRPYRLNEAGRMWGDFIPDEGITRIQGNAESAKVGNSDSHRLEGQNVLFVDGSASFQERSYCAVDKDNIYTYQSTFPGQDLKGQMPMVYQYGSSHIRRGEDSLLLNDDNEWDN